MTTICPNCHRVIHDIPFDHSVIAYGLSSRTSNVSLRLYYKCHDCRKIFAEVREYKQIGQTIRDGACVGDF